MLRWQDLTYSMCNPEWESVHGMFVVRQKVSCALYLEAGVSDSCLSSRL